MNYGTTSANAAGALLATLRKTAIVSCALLGFVAALGSGNAVAAPSKPKLAAPTISCAGATQTSINIQVCAGANGLPAGFTLQWMKAADYVANGNTWSEDPLACSAGFAGEANLSRYNLGPGECVTVNVGDFLFDNGASTNCPGGLECGTRYVFRSFGHGNSAYVRSDNTAVLTCATLDCGHVASCTLTQGYWKTHGYLPAGNNLYTWPDLVKANGLTLGARKYTPEELLAILNTPAAGNGLIALAHQLIATKLNLAAGADPTAIAGDVATADALIGSLVVPPIGSDSLKPTITSGLTTALANYNEGATGPGHCDDLETTLPQ
jgi:hypothetical protein